jgi:hypothetical protein
MPTQTISIDEDLLAILKERASANERSLSKEISFRLKLSLREEELSNNSEGNEGVRMT